MSPHICHKETDIKYLRRDVEKLTDKIEKANAYLLIVFIGTIGFLIVDKFF